MEVLAWIGIVLLAVVAVVLLMPWQYGAHGEIDGTRVDGDVRVRWALGLLSFRIARGSGAGLYMLGVRVVRIPLGKDDKGKKKAKKKTRGDRKSGRGLGWSFGARRVLTRLFRTLHLRGHLEGRFGTGDPADTALCYGVVNAVGSGLPGVTIDVWADYLDEVVELRGSLRGWFWPAQALAVFLAILVRRDTRRALAAR